MISDDDVLLKGFSLDSRIVPHRLVAVVGFQDCLSARSYCATCPAVSAMRVPIQVATNQTFRTLRVLFSI